MKRDFAWALGTVLAVLLISTPSYAIKEKYDKVTGITEMKTSDFIAKYNAFSGNFIFYRFASYRNSENKHASVIIVRTVATTELLDENEPLYLLIDNEERVKLAPLTAKEREQGGTGTYWGFGISTYKRQVQQQLVYQMDADLFQKIANAKRVDARLASAKFDIEGFEIRQVKKVAEFALGSAPSK